MKHTRYSSGGEHNPSRLRTIPDTPKQLFWTGENPDIFAHTPTVAIVGSRRVSPYGRQVTLNLAEALAQHGVVIVSGLALGVDALAHTGALNAGGKTIAVLPCSLDTVYPATNTALARRILKEQGTLVSEYEPGATFTFKYNFVARNRIIAGLSDVVLITEAAEGSGSLHTADFALDQGKEVLVVPGNITSPTSAGTNNLLKVGATPVTSVDDVLRALNMESTTLKASSVGGSPQQQLVLRLLSEGVHDGDKLHQKSGLTTSEFNQALTMLEINGQVRPAGANTWY